MNRHVLKTVYETLRPLTLPKTNLNFIAPIYDDMPKNLPVFSVPNLDCTKFTNAGIVGLKINQNQAAMVEISSMNNGSVSVVQMLQFLENVLDACHLFLEKRRFLDNYVQIFMKQDKLGMLNDKYGLNLASHAKSLSDKSNGLIVPKRAIILNSLMSIQFYGLTADSVQKDSQNNLSFQFGQCGILLAYKKKFDSSMNDEPLETVLKNICKHILVMDPLTIDQQKMRNVSPNRCLLTQSYMFDKNISVAKFATLNGLKLVDFKRFECGNDSNNDHIITPDLLECAPRFFGTLL